MREAKIAALREELDRINRANVVFWKQGLNSSREARAEHQRRQDRLQEIMKELADLVLPDSPSEGGNAPLGP